MSKFTRKLQGTKWNIAIVDNTMQGIIDGELLKYRLMQYDNKDTWYADPFILDVTDTDYLILAEEMQYSQDKARISKLVIDKETMKLKKVVPLLSLPTHLSYPAIIRKNDKVYVYPESGLSGKLTRYLYDEKNERFVEDGIIMEGPLADATITNLFGGEYLFCTKLPNCNGMKLEIYKKNQDELYKHYQDIDFEENIARMAGDFFKVGNTIYRPAQDCNKYYGHGTVIQTVSLKNGLFEFKEVRRLFSRDEVYDEGLHTLNSYKNVVVIDLVGKPRFPLAKKLIIAIKKMVGKHE